MTDLLRDFFLRTQQFVDEGLNRYLPPDSAYPESVHQSMRYSVFAGGKRIRPALALAAFELCHGNVKEESILLACCALEMLHAFSLIHDDLPCMDDDDFRRGKPTNHRVFGEAVAVLAGDALCIHAFELLSRTGQCAVIREIAEALGTSGMIGGQVVDIQSEGKAPTRDGLAYIHTHKTEKFITASLRTGALLAGAAPDRLQALTDYGRKVGLAFQVADDILDVEGSTEQIGKDAHSDEERGKITYPAVHGLQESKRIARELVDTAKKALECFGEQGVLLRETADYIAERIR